MPLSSTPTIFPPKRIKKISNALGVNSPPVLTPTPPSNPINHAPLTPTLLPLASQMTAAPIPPSQPLTPIQRLIHHNTRKYQNNEPKYNRPQPDHLDLGSTLRIRTHHQGYKLQNLVFFHYFWLLSPKSLIQQSNLHFLSIFFLMIVHVIH